MNYEISAPQFPASCRGRRNAPGRLTIGPGEAYPVRPVTIVVPFAAGGSTDVLARILSPHLAALLGQPVVIENVTGAGGMTGSARVAKSPPDGYQLVFGTQGTHAQNQSLYKNPLYNAATDFAPVVLVAELPPCSPRAGACLWPICSSSWPTPRRTRGTCNTA